MAVTPQGRATQPIRKSIENAAQYNVVIDAAISLPGLPLQANTAVIQVEGQAARWRADGTPPTAAAGMPLAIGAQLVFDGDLALFQIIGVAAGGKLDVEYMIGPRLA